MDKQKKRHLITAALPYANGPLHIGHLAGCYLPADAYARFLRAQGKDVVFIGGSDEYGVPISIRALKEKTSPQSIVDKYHHLIKESFEALGIAYDIYARTTDPLHTQTAQTLFKHIADRGIFETHTKEQFYDPVAQRFLADRYIMGECPYCHASGAYGDQCEKCGSTLSPEELLHPQSTLSQSVPIKKPSTHWYLPLQDFQDTIAEWILSHEKDWKPNVIGQCKSWLDRGLHARAMTRDADWGIPVPLADAEGKVLYVWFDAPIGYISATQALKKNWQPYWEDEDTELIHFIGKDNIVFHCIIFPIMLQASGQPFILPTNVVANEFLNIEGQKISTSRNWAVWVDAYLRDFPNMQDALRYTLFSILPETKDADFTWKDFQARVNNELVAILGNFVYRTFILAHKLCAGRIPILHKDILDETDEHIRKCVEEAPEKIATHMYQFHFRDALQEVMDIARQANKYLQKKEPWVWAQSQKIDAQKIIDNTLHHCLQITANLAIILHPFLPFTAHKIRSQLKVVPKILEWKNAGKMDLLRERYFIGTPELLFSKVEDEIIEQQIEKLHKTTAAMLPSFPPIKAPINIADFQKADLRIGRIIAAEKIPKSKKLYALKVDIGTTIRSIVSGVAQHFSPEDLMNKQVVVLVNVEAKKLAGVLSEGMLLFIENHNQQLVLLSPVHPTDNGALVN